MRDKEKIKLLEQQIELLEKVIELQRLSAPVITVILGVVREVYPTYPAYLPYYQPWNQPSYTGTPLPAWPVITCQG